MKWTVSSWNPSFSDPKKYFQKGNVWKLMLHSLWVIDYGKSIFRYSLMAQIKWTWTFFGLFNIFFDRLTDKCVCIKIGAPNSFPIPPYFIVPIDFKLSILFRNDWIDKAHTNGFASSQRMFIFWFPKEWNFSTVFNVGSRMSFIMEVVLLKPSYSLFFW